MILTSDLVFRTIVYIFHVLFKIGIPNFVCGCILGWQSVTYHFRVTMILTLKYDVVFQNNRVQSISLVLFEIGILNLVCNMW